MSARAWGAACAIAAAVACAAPAQARIIGSDLEVILGSNTASALEQRYGLHRDEEQQQRLETLGKQMVAVSGRTGLNYRFGVLDTREINALAVPGGWVYATRGLMEENLSQDELAFVVAHEVAHIARRHGVKQLEQALGVSLVLGLIFDQAGTTQRLVSSLLQLLLESGYSRDHERDADLTAVDYMLKTGHNPQGGVAFLRRLDSIHRRSPTVLDRWFATHPPTGARVSYLEEKIEATEKDTAR